MSLLLVDCTQQSNSVNMQARRGKRHCETVRLDEQRHSKNKHDRSVRGIRCDAFLAKNDVVQPGYSYRLSSFFFFFFILDFFPFFLAFSLSTASSTSSKVLLLLLLFCLSFFFVFFLLAFFGSSLSSSLSLLLSRFFFSPVFEWCHSRRLLVVMSDVCGLCC